MDSQRNIFADDASDSKPPIMLNNGREVRHRPMPNGATEAYMADGGTMTEAEWSEYCAATRSYNAARHRCSIAARKARSKAAFENRNKGTQQ